MTLFWVLYVQDVEANTVRLKEHEQAVLVLEKSPRASTLGSIKYVFCVSTSHSTNNCSSQHSSGEQSIKDKKAKSTDLPLP